MINATNFAEKYHFLGIELNLSLKAKTQFQNNKHTVDWALGSNPRDNGHVTNYI